MSLSKDMCYTAPGFGADDYQTCMRYGMELVVPVATAGSLLV